MGDGNEAKRSEMRADARVGRSWSGSHSDTPLRLLSAAAERKRYAQSLNEPRGKEKS